MAGNVEAVREGTAQERIKTLSRSILNGIPGVKLSSGFAVDDTVLVLRITILEQNNFFAEVMTNDGEWVMGEKYETAGVSPQNVAQAVADAVQAYLGMPNIDL